MPYIAIRVLRIRWPRISVWRTVEVSAEWSASGSSHTGGYMTLTSSGFLGDGSEGNWFYCCFTNNNTGHRLIKFTLLSCSQLTPPPACAQEPDLLGQKRAGQSRGRLRSICHAQRLPVEGRLQISPVNPGLRRPDPLFPVSHCCPGKVCRSVSRFLPPPFLPSSLPPSFLPSLFLAPLFSSSFFLISGRCRADHRFDAPLSVHTKLLSGFLPFPPSAPPTSHIHSLLSSACAILPLNYFLFLSIL